MAKQKQKTRAPEESLREALVPQEEAPYEIPANWCWVKVGAINEYVSRVCDPMLKLDTLFELYSVPSCANHYPEIIKGAEIGSTKQIVEKEDILLCKINPRINRVWKVYQYTNNEQIASSEWIVVRNQSLNSDYLVNWFQSPCFRRYMVSDVSGVGGSLTRAKPKIVQKYPIPLPPLAEQQRIVDRIESLFAKLDEAKEKAEAALESFKLRRAAILHKAFTGTLTAKWREEHGVGMESWIPTTSKNLFEYVTSGSRGWAKYYADKGAVFLRMGNLDHGTIDLDLSDLQYVNLPDKAEGQRSLVKKNDILISITADVGMIGYVREIPHEAYINQHVALARPVKENDSEFIAWYLVSDIGSSQLQNKKRGATKIGLGLNDIRDVILNMPCLDEQKEIVRLLDDFFAKEQKAKALAGSVLKTVDTMKQSILARAFRGELGTGDSRDEPAKDMLLRMYGENEELGMRN